LVSGSAAVHAAEAKRPHRRVVTGVNAAGKSVISSDGPVPSEGVWSTPEGADGADLWILDQVPVDLADTRDPTVGYKWQQWPSPGGVIARIVRWPPGFEIKMHRSATLDFGFAISGHLELLLEEGSTTIGPGDCVVQRGTVHGWRVVGKEPYVGMAVLVAAKS
jgi:quercetin dioxygenase-like cupin family protein